MVIGTTSCTVVKKGGTPGVDVLGSLYIKKGVGLFLGPNLGQCDSINYNFRSC